MPSPSVALKIPHPQADVGSPVPNQSAQEDLFKELDALGQQNSTPVEAAIPEPAPEAPAAEVPVATSPNEAPVVAAPVAPVAPTGPNVLLVDDLINQWKAEEKQKDIARQLKYEPTSEEGDGAPVFSRMLANLGKEPETQRQLLQRSMGLDYETKVEDDAVWFRKKGETHFLRMDPKEWKGAGEFLKDMTVDIMPDVAEGLISATVTAIAARAGAIGGGSIGLASGGPGGAMVGAGMGYVAGGAAGLPLGGAVGAQARSSLISALGVPNEVDLKKEAAFNSVATILGAGASQAFRRPAAVILDKVATALGNTKLSRVGQMAKVREGIENFSKEHGLPAPQAQIASGVELGEKIKSVIDVTEERLGKQVGLVKQKAMQVAGTNPLPATKFMARAKEILESEGVEFDPSKGLAKLPADYQKAKPFGDSTGAVLKQIVEDYNTGLRNNGLNMNQMFNNLDFYKNEAGFQKNLPDAANGVYQRLRGALREDRDAALVQVLPAGSPESQLAKKAFGEFQTNIDEVRSLQKLARKSPEKFAEALVAPKESGRIVQLKQVLGENSEAFSDVKGAWYSGIINKAVDPETGLVAGSILKKELDKYGPDVLNHMMTKEQQNVLKALAGRAEKIHFEDLISNPGGSAFFKDFVRANISGVSTTESKVRVLWSMFGSNAKVAKYLSNDGLLDLAKEIKDPTARSQTLKAAEWMAKMVRVSEIKKTAKGVEILKPPFDVGIMGGIINAMEQQVDESMPEYLQRRKTQLNELRQENGLPIPTEDANQ